ncbi:hypothetical protein COCNU_scaffold060974G000010 [Cocos nucifera]|nr:hypothetical protein [Cocos nucifera]
MVTVIPPGSGPSGLHGVRYGEEGVVRWIVTAILAGYGSHEAGYGESGVVSSDGHVVRLRAAWGLLRRERCRQTGSGGHTAGVRQP